MIEKNVLCDGTSNPDSALEWSVKDGKISCYHINDDWDMLTMTLEDFDKLVKFVEKYKNQKTKKEKK